MIKNKPFYGKELPLFQARCDVPGCDMLSGLSTSEEKLKDGCKEEGWKLNAIEILRSSKRLDKCNFCVEKELTNLGERV